MLQKLLCGVLKIITLVLFSINSGCTWIGTSSTYTEERVKPTLSPYLSLFRTNGFPLPDDTQIAPVFSIHYQDQDYELLEYNTLSDTGIQIKQNNTLVADPEVAFDLLLSYAWSPQYHQVTNAELDNVRLLQGRLQGAKQEYQSFFEFAASLEPVLAKVDELKDKQITGIPVVQIGPIPLIDITNYWDLICTIPLDIFDLCMLEPVLREIHEQGVEIEQLLASTSVDLQVVIEMLEAQERGEVQNGIQLKEATEKAISSLSNLISVNHRFDKRANFGKVKLSNKQTKGGPKQ